MFSDESIFCVQQVDCRVKVWRRYHKVTAFDDDSIGQHVPCWKNKACQHWKPDLNPAEHLWDQLVCAVCARVLPHATEAPVC